MRWKGPFGWYLTAVTFVLRRRRRTESTQIRPRIFGVLDRIRRHGEMGVWRYCGAASGFGRMGVENALESSLWHARSVHLSQAVIQAVYRCEQSINVSIT